MKRIEYLTKDDKVEFGSTKYKAISEEKVTTTVRKELVDVGIAIIPISQTVNVTELARSDKSVNQRTDVNVTYRIQNIEDPDDFIFACSSGSGVDTQDKGVGKAMTYAYKYLLLRTFAIPTGEDPDKISSAETDAKMATEIEESTITKTMEDALRKAISDNKIPDEEVLEVLGNFGYNRLAEIKLSDLKKVQVSLIGE
jgi:hypothetical protein